MKFVAASLGWLLLLALLGALATLGFGTALIHHLPPPPLALRLMGGGAAAGFDAFLFGFCFALLPGARRPPGAPRPLGLAQGLWAVLGMAAVMLAASLLINSVLGLEDAVLIVRHAPRPGRFCRRRLSDDEFPGGGDGCGFVHRQLPAPLQPGATTGWQRHRHRLASRPPRAYAVAALLAAAIVTLVVAMYHLIPPNMAKLQDLPMAKLFSASGPALLPPVIIAILFAPVLEEITFAASPSPGWRRGRARSGRRSSPWRCS